MNLPYTTPSVVVRILLWILLLGGGTLLSRTLDRRCFPDGDFAAFRGVTLAFAAVVLWFSFRAAAVGGKALARYGREGRLPRLETNRLVSKGVYSCTRHPMLLGLIFLPLGLALLLASPSFIFCIAPAEGALILLLMLVVEEREAEAKFGEAYIEYRKRTPILPKSLDCWKKLLVGKERG